ncbi:tenascin-like isoform X5 [Dunckerocampus dactyliophorus]|uniref:tenascin-like isoform X5 n=1 Tax=Dunckerocampus dactyliophorus TaxID=161453 RepID=UPI002405B488|nr:tenascin-like isoform X5 [Dunckerocampus dactyliophorus]
MATRGLMHCLLLSVLLTACAAGLVKKMLRHRRQTPEEHNITLPGADQPVVFNHVYNINVPASSLCSVNLDGPKSVPQTETAVTSGRHAAHQATDGENQIVFTHRINIPRQVCGCGAEVPGLRDLMSRIEMLEGEVSALRSQCGGEGTCCGAQVAGNVRTRPFCGGHGNYSAETCSCRCEPGWQGPNCTESECPNMCQGRGRCVGGMCICSDGFLGEDCSELICPKNCYGRGRCVNGTCRCDRGFGGEDCGQRTCPGDCHSNGFCVDGRCVCAAGYSGEDCSRPTCLNDCSDRGTCFNGMCICDDGYQGEDCSQLACPNNCNSRGQCINGQCACDVGFQGSDCSELSCPSNCLQRGRCINGQCVCQEGFAGEDCSIKTCPSNCFGRGDCVEGRCRCHPGFAGDDCAQLSCPNNCRNHGRCIDGQCVCDEGFAGEDCGQKACPNDCLARGYCDDGVCVCQEGYSGVDCSVQTCPDNCNNRGRCINGRCTCESGYEGESCAELSCLNNCHDKGHCVKGQCLCDEGYIGDDCFEVSPPKDLSVGEVTMETVDLSWINDMLVTEYLVTYVPTQPGGLLLEFTVPGDRTTATVKELEPGLEYQINVYAVLSNKRSVPVSARVATALPQPEGLRFKSVRETSVEVVWEQLNIPFDGWEIYFRNTKEENGKVVSTVPSNQNHFLQSGLGPGQEYEVSISVIKNNTRGPPTSKRVTTNIDAPQQLQVQDVTDSSALVSWSQPAAPSDRVTIFYKPSSAPSEDAKVEIFPPDKQHSLEGLKPDTEYTVSLVSRRQDANSEPTITTFTTGIDAPRHLVAVSQTEDSITLRWRNSRANVDSYRVKYSPLSGAAHGEEVFPRGPGDTTTATISGLKPGTEYGIGVTGVKNERESLPATVNAATDLDPPRALEQTGSTETSISIQWQKPHAKVTSYRLVYVSRDGQVEEAEVPPTDTSFILLDLTPAMSYSITLTAERGHKMSLPVTLTASTVAPKASPPDVLGPAAPTPSSQDLQTPAKPLQPETTASSGDLRVLSVTSTSISLAWSVPDQSYQSFSVELLAPSAPTRVMVLTGSGRSVEMEGLAPSTLYEITLQGMLEGNFTCLTLKGFATTEAQKPSVGNLTFSDITWDGFTASWSPSTGADFDSFVVEVTNLDNMAESQNLTVSGGALSLGLWGLNANTSYMVGLYGLYRGSFLEPVYAEAATACQPSLGHLYVSNLTYESFWVTWNDTEGDFDGFVLEIIDSDWLMQPREYNLSRNATSHEVSGLRPSSDYVAYLYGTFKASRTRAVSVVASTAEEPDLSRLVVSNVTSDRVSLSWRAGDKAFDNFVVEVRESALPSQAMGQALPAHVRSTVMAGLKASTRYDIKLYASAGGRNTHSLFAVATTGRTPQAHGDPSSSQSPETELPSSSLCSEDVPLLGPIAASSPSPHNLTLTWSTVSGHFDGFVIRVSDSDQQSGPQEFSLPGDATSFILSNLMDATGYNVELYGLSHGRRTPSVVAHAATAPLPKVENLTISNVTPFGFRVSWGVKQRQAREEPTPSSGPFSHFNLVVTDSGWLLAPQEFTVPGNQSHLDIGGLITGIGYEVRLTGVSEAGLHSRPLSTVAVTEAEPEVEHLFVSDITVDSFRVSWAADEDLFDRFVIKLRDGKRSGLPQEHLVAGDQRTKLITGLAGGTEYEIELYGDSLDHTSQPIFGVAQTGLMTPKGLRFSDVTDSSTVVHWSMPQSAVDNYRITYVPLEGGNPMMVTVDGHVLQALLPNMSPGKMYQVTVTAVKGLEESDPSVDSITTVLDRPQGLTAVNVTDSSALLLWQPSVALVDGYVIMYSSESASPVVEQVSGATTELAMRSLAPGSLYTVELFATKEAQKSASVGTEFTTDVDPPRDLMAVNIQADSATLSWKPPQAAISVYVLTFSSPDGSAREVTLSPTASSYIMAQLARSTEYTVQMQAVAGDRRSRHITTTFTTVGELHRHPKDCAQIFLNGQTASGVYTVYVGGVDSQAIQVYCDMDTDGGGWMVFLRRQNGRLDFFRNWKNYTAGFGNVNDEFWLGLSNLHKITSAGQYVLRVDLRDSGELAYAQYDRFSIAEPRTRYKISIGAYSGTAGDSMTYHQGRPFSTYDNDNDIAVTNCALSYKGAFWYKNCHRVNLMGKYGDRSHSKGVNWFHWKGHETSIQFAEMKMRPADFGSLESRKKRS